MNAEIVAVGTELLLGDIVNTDSAFIAQKLSELGINVYYQTVVGDNPKRLADTLKTALSRADIVITSGGLGPTNDDISKEVLCDCMNKKLVLDKPSLESIEAYFAKTNRKMPDSNIKQAMLPEGGIVLKNYNGTAPGGIIESEGKIAIFLPGPPKELELMWKTGVYPYLSKKTDSMLYSKTLRIFGVGESRVDELLHDMMTSSTNPTVAPYAKDNECIVRLCARCKDENHGENIIKPYEEKIRSILGDAVYACGDKSIQEVVFELLCEKKLTVSFAESLTGGMAASEIIDFPGSSNVIKESYVTYCDEAKSKILGVDKAVLKEKSAVCEKVAVWMAEGLYNISGADICVSLTGVAGPGCDDFGNEQGTVFIGIHTKKSAYAKEFHFTGNRQKIRARSSMQAYFMIFEELKKLDKNY